MLDSYSGLPLAPSPSRAARWR